MDPYYLTTPIYYPNGEPHLGHVYTTTCADVVARYHRLAGREVFFLTGTDEHGIKMVQTAEKLGTTPAELADRNAGVFRSTFERYGYTFDDFIRTSEPRHHAGASHIVRRFLDNGDVYLGEYQGWYDLGEENFVTETEAKKHDYKSPVSGRPLERYAEPSYFFRLGKYVDAIIGHIEAHPDFLRPESRRNEVLSKLRDGVSDLSISRTSLKWGIPMPGDADHVLYVWVDALSNYVTALGYGANDDARFRRYWPADLHLIGKEILWFHAVYWPAMLMSLGLPLPKTVFAHGWWTVNGAKMSKSLGNFVGLGELDRLADRYGHDAIRYHLLRAAPFGGDLDWGDDDFEKSYGELQRVVGNCLNRVLTMVTNYRDGRLPAPGETGSEDVALLAAAAALPGRIADAYGRLDLQQAATLPVELARLTNGYVDATQPFKLAKDPARAARLDTVLHHAVAAMHATLTALLPVLPAKAAEGLAAIPSLAPGTPLGRAVPLFPKVE